VPAQSRAWRGMIFAWARNGEEFSSLTNFFYY